MGNSAHQILVDEVTEMFAFYPHNAAVSKVRREGQMRLATSFDS